MPGGGGRKRGEGRCRWAGHQGSSGDVSQLHAWLAMLTLTLTRQRGDTSRPCRGPSAARAHVCARARGQINFELARAAFINAQPHI